MRRSLSVSSTADLLGVSVDTVRRLADAGHLPSYRLLPSGWRRFNAVDVLEFRERLRRPKDGKAS
ncbi:MAG: helix-turn-helix domain-containing protein [Chloroflexi bacterium]|nr:helix-turn-helix domain-containing protein [Chloroflexota bacterium]